MAIRTVTPRILRPEHAGFASIEIVRAPDTHSAPSDARPRQGELLADCGAWVPTYYVSADPTCAGCQAELAKTADDVFGAAEAEAPVVQSPNGFQEDGDDYFRYATKLTRQERLQGLADDGVDTWDDYHGNK
jgi:hypothetical protein